HGWGAFTVREGPGRYVLGTIHRPHQIRGRIPQRCCGIALSREPESTYLPPRIRSSTGGSSPSAAASRKSPVCVHDRTSFRLAPTDRGSALTRALVKEIE